MFESDVLHGEQRNYYAVRLIALCVASAVAAAAVVAAVAALLITSNSRGVAYDNAVAGCERNNALRRESNARIHDHEMDAENLARLAGTLGRNRAAEASVFAAIGGAFSIERKVDPLVRLLREAARRDQQIADAQALVRFGALPIVDCHSDEIIQQP